MTASRGIYTPVICPQCHLDHTTRSDEEGMAVAHCRICGTTWLHNPDDTA